MSPVPVSVRRPESAPGELVTLSREGGPRLNRLLDKPGIGIYCWAPTEQRAFEIADDVADVMERLPFDGGYSRVEMESMRSDPDPDTRSPRWYLSYTLTTFEPKE